MNTAGKKLLILYANEPIKNHKGPTPDEQFNCIKGISDMMVVPTHVFPTQ